MDPNTLQWPYLIAGVVVGLFGWLLYWAGIPIMGGVIGACAGGALGILATDFVKIQAAPYILPAVGILLGAILGILLMRAIQVYFFFAAGACLGGTLAWNLLSLSLPRGTPLNLDLSASVVIILGALTGGLLMVFFRRFIVALVTSLVGVALIAYGLPARFHLLGGLVAFVVFMSVQIGLVSRFIEKEEFDTRMRAHRHRPRHEDYEEEE